MASKREFICLLIMYNSIVNITTLDNSLYIYQFIKVSLFIDAYLYS
jgi:hypothetical protein